VDAPWTGFRQGGRRDSGGFGPILHQSFNPERYSKGHSTSQWSSELQESSSAGAGFSFGHRKPAILTTLVLGAFGVPLLE